MKKTSCMIIAIVLVLCAASAFAQAPGEGKEGEKKYLTRSEAAKLLSTTDFLKNKIGQLLSWSIGYDISSVSRAKLVPSIKYIQAMPVKAPPDGRTVISLLVAVDDPGGLGNISGVRADLSGIGQLSNMALVDNGLWGDIKAGDGVYTIQTNVKQGIPFGEKEIAVAVANKKGWLTLSRVSLDVEKNPTMIWAKATPASVPADGSTKTLLEVAVVNPGRVEDMGNVVVDLSSIGAGRAEMKKTTGNGTRPNIFSLEITVPSSASAGEKKLPVSVENSAGGKAQGEIVLNVTKQ